MKVNIHYMFHHFFDKDANFIIILTEENADGETTKEALPEDIISLLSSNNITRERKHLYKNGSHLSQREFVALFANTPYRLIEDWNLG